MSLKKQKVFQHPNSYSNPKSGMKLRFMELKYYVKKAFSEPPHVVAKKAWKKFSKDTVELLRKYRDFKSDTHVSFNVPIITKSFIDIRKLDVSKIDRKIARHLSEMYRSHRFDLLGSGWVKVGYDKRALGVEGYRYDMNVKFNFENILLRPHIKRAKEIFSLVDKDYEPIDWQKDFKSGFRWNAKKWYREQRYGYFPGADIKVPWELSRFQHLPQLAIFSLVDPKLAKENTREFRNQVLDFIAFNPPRMGVNWTCTMDVAIRAANMLIAYDMFSQIDRWKILDVRFKQIFSNSIFEHGEFIVNNLEYSEYLTSNHYLSDIAGLLFIGAYLDKVEWISFSASELLREVKKQFYDDGGNFESSTSYHRLSGELILFSTALLQRLMSERKVKHISYKISGGRLKIQGLYDEYLKELPQNFIDRFFKIGRFTFDVMKPSGEVPQIGDNDSGRFIKLTPVGSFLTNKEAEEKYLNLRGYTDLVEEYDTPEGLFWDENVLNHKPFLAGFFALFKDRKFKPFADDFPLEFSFVRQLSGGKTLNVPQLSYEKPPVESSGINIDELAYQKVWEYKLPFKVGNLKFFSYPKSGIYVFKNNRFYLCFYCTPLGQNDKGGHSHNDKLSVELWVDGVDVLRDPGTYVYTPLPWRRNEFRSVKAHNTIFVDDIEQNNWDSEEVYYVFSLKNETKCFILSFGENFIYGVVKYKDILHFRKIEILEDKVKIEDRCNKPFTQNFCGFKYYSPGYGKIMCIK